MKRPFNDYPIGAKSLKLLKNAMYTEKSCRGFLVVDRITISFTNVLLWC